MAKVLYVTLTGIGEAIGRSQVLEYLIDLSKENKIFLLSFERNNDLNQIQDLQLIMDKYNIEWSYLSYSNKFGILSSISQIIRAVFLSIKISKLNQISIIHARSMIPALIAKITILFHKSKLLFDIRGFTASEFVDRNRVKESSLLYKILLKLDIFLYKTSDFIVALTFASKEILHKKYNISKKRIEVIPTCANKKKFYKISTHEIEKYKKEFGFNKNDKIIVHSGTVSGWYLFEEEIILMKLLMEKDERIKFLILNRGEHKYIRNLLKEKGINEDRYHLTYSKFEDVNKYLNISSAAIYFIIPSYSKKAAAPTKFAEIVACHLPSIINKGVGDMDMYLSKYNVGYSVDEHNITSYDIDNILTMIENKEIINKDYDSLFSTYFDKDIAVQQYNNIYLMLKEERSL